MLIGLYLCYQVSFTVHGRFTAFSLPGFHGLLVKCSLLTYTTRQCGVVMFSVTYVCLSVVNELTFEILGLESSFLECAGTASEHLRQVGTSKLSGQGQGQGQGHRSRKRAHIKGHAAVLLHYVMLAS